MARRTHRGRRSDRTAKQPPVAQETVTEEIAISTRRPPVPASGVAALMLLGIVFLGMGYMFYDEWLEPLRLRSWITTPCTIVSSVLPASRKPGASGKITYAYDFQGQHYQSSQYYLHAGPSAHTVRKHPPGQQTTCFVNPAEPKDAFLVNTLPEEIDYLWLFLMFPIGGLCLICAALGWIAYSLTKRRRPANVADANGATILKPRLSPPQEVALYGVICFFYNIVLAIPWILEIGALRLRDDGGFDVFFFIVILIPFSTLGIVGMCLFGKKVLALFNPRPTLALAPGRIPLGGSARLTWQFTGPTGSLQSLQIVLSGTEQAVHQVYRDAYTYKRVFHRTVLFRAHAPDPTSAGECRLVIPMETMHSFESVNNSIVWSIDVRATVAWLPQIATQFPIKVTPHEQPLA
jgi:hypothetical protein